MERMPDVSYTNFFATRRLVYPAFIERVRARYFELLLGLETSMNATFRYERVGYEMAGNR